MTAFKRASMPWLNAKYTEVQVQPGNVEIPIGRDLEEKTLFTGRIPRQANFNGRTRAVHSGNSRR